MTRKILPRAMHHLEKNVRNQSSIDFLSDEEDNTISNTSDVIGVKDISIEKRNDHFFHLYVVMVI
jgi:hypothetical protein